MYLTITSINIILAIFMMAFFTNGMFFDHKTSTERDMTKRGVYNVFCIFNFLFCIFTLFLLVFFNV